MKVSNYIIAHKKFNVPKIDGYTPIQVGAEGKDDLGYIKDNIGENISKKNPNYCELTGIYWIWKNDKDSDIIGISHYRRYFATNRFFSEKIVDKNDMEKLINNNDIIIAKKEIYKQSVYEQYCTNSGFAKDLDLVKNIIQKKYSSEYIDAFEKVMNSNKLSQYNMLITKKEIFNKYCEWLFKILFELEKNVDLTEYNDYQKRIYGFLAERLLNIWLYANKNITIKYLPVINTECSLKEKVKINLRRIKNYILFHINERKDR